MEARPNSFLLLNSSATKHFVTTEFDKMAVESNNICVIQV